MQYVGTGRIGTQQNVAYTGTAGVITNPMGGQTYKARIIVTTDAWVTFDGTTPSATAGAYVPALAAEYFTVTPGQTPKAVQVASGGTLYVTEII